MQNKRQTIPLAGVSSAMTITKIDQTVGARIKQARRLKGLTQAQLGEAVGVSFQQIQKYEKGQNRIGAGALYKIGNSLELPLHEMFGLMPPADDPPPPQRSQLGEVERKMVFDSPRSSYPDEAVDLLAAFDRIDNITMRDQVVDLAKTFANFFIHRDKNN